MIDRRISGVLEERLAEVPAVVLLGPRQSGKTTLAESMSQHEGALYLDLESEQDLAKLAEPELYLSDNLHRFVVLDEIHRSPGLFPVLRGLIDRARRAGRSHGLYLLLGTASIELLRQAGETLAGRVSYLHLDPFNVLEVCSTTFDNDRLWLRGGFPDSYLAADDARSLRWRQDFIRSYLERDIPQLGPRIPAERLRRFWTMLAHHQGGLLNTAELARNIGVDGRTAAGYIDLLVDLLLVRRLPPWHANVGKRLVKSPKVFVKDTGIAHALLTIVDKEGLLAHPVVGASWEAFVTEQLLSAAPDTIQGYFYRTAAGAEIDLLLSLPGDRLWAIEIKRSLSPKVQKGFHIAADDLNVQRRIVVYPGNERYTTTKGIDVVAVSDFAQELSEF